MRLTHVAVAATITVTLALGACGMPFDGDTGERTAPVPAAAPAASDSGGAETPADSSQQGVEGTVVRFSAGEESVDVTIVEDTPATRDFVSMLPLTTTMEEFNGREKIADLPRELEHDGSPGSDPENGDLIYFIPWANLGFYYDAEGIGYSDQTLRLGTYDASPEELARFEAQETTVEIVD